METKKQKGMAPPRYDEAFKEGTIRMVTEQGGLSSDVAQELDICVDTLRSWLKKAGQANRLNREQQKIKELETKLKIFKKTTILKRRGHRHLKKISRHPVQTIEDKFLCTLNLKNSGFSVEQVCQILEISCSGFYEWLNRKPSARKQNNIALRKAIIELHNKSCNSLNQA